MTLLCARELPRWLGGKESACQCRRLGMDPRGGEDPPEKEMATHSSVLAWDIPWTEEAVGYSPWCCTESDRTEQLNNNTPVCTALKCGPPSLVSSMTHGGNALSRVLPSCRRHTAAAPHRGMAGQDLNLVSLLRGGQTLQGCPVLTKLIRDLLVNQMSMDWLLLGGGTPFTLPSLVTSLAPNFVFHQCRFTLCPCLQDPSHWG